MNVELAPHQIKALNELSNGKILCGGVGSGKTRTALAYYCSNEIHEDIYVITTARKRDSLDWEKEAAAFGVGTSADATVAGVLTVDSWNNISKYEGIEGAFFIFDEQRLVGAGAWVYSFLKIAKKNSWIMLSATPGDTWLEYIPVFVANGFYKNRTEFKREHVIYSTYTKFPKVDRFVGVSKLVRLRNSILVDMPYQKTTVRNVQIVSVDHDEQLMKKVMKDRWHVFEARPLRDAAELFQVMRKVVNSDASRLATVQSLMERHPRVIVFYNFDYELDILRTLAKSVHTETISSSDNKHYCEEKKCHYNQEIISSSPSSASPSHFQQRLPTNNEQQSKRCSTCLSQSAPCTSQDSDTISNSASSTAKGKASRRESSVKMSSKVIKQNNKLLDMKQDDYAEYPDATDKIQNVHIAEWNGHKHEPLPESKRWVYLVQYAAGAEAWNCITTDAMIFYSMNYSYKLFEQAQGRIDRPLATKYKILHYYVLKSNAWIDSQIWAALKRKETFNERKTGISW